MGHWQTNSTHLDASQLHCAAAGPAAIKTATTATSMATHKHTTTQHNTHHNPHKRYSMAAMLNSPAQDAELISRHQRWQAHSHTDTARRLLKQPIQRHVTVLIRAAGICQIMTSEPHTFCIAVAGSSLKQHAQLEWLNSSPQASFIRLSLLQSKQ